MSSSGRRGARSSTSVRDLLVETWHDTYDAIYGVERVTEITNEWHALDALWRAASSVRLTPSSWPRPLTAPSSARHRRRSARTVSSTLDRLYVRPARQGQGLGTAMLRACEAWFPQGRLHAPRGRDEQREGEALLREARLFRIA